MLLGQHAILCKTAIQRMPFGVQSGHKPMLTRELDLDRSNIDRPSILKGWIT